MLLAVDIGNTNIDFALIGKQGRIIRKYASASTGKLNLKPILGKIKGRIDRIFVVSVVPEVFKKVKRDLKRNFRYSKIFVIGKDIKVPLKCAYNKREIGEDRLTTAFAAKSLYGLPVLIIDFGTAVTFDAVSKKGVYLGGLILPGIKMSLESLSERTALLPRTYLKKTRSFIGRNTHSSIRNGMIYGYAAISDGLIALFKRKIDKNIKVIATGGDASLIRGYTRMMKKIDLDLSLKGLYFLSKNT